MILPGRELNLPETRLFNKHESHFSTEALFVFRDHCRRGVSGAHDDPIWVRDHVNRKLSEMPDYRTHVGAVTLYF
jgi:hypothetical protein